MKKEKTIGILCVLSVLSGLAPSPFLAGEKGIEKPLAITALAVTPDGKSLVEASQAGVFHRAIGAKNRRAIPSNLDHVHALAFSPNGKTLAIAGGFPAEKGVVELWSWPEKKPLDQLQEHKDVVYDVVWLGEGKRLATAGADRIVRLWNLTQQESSIALAGHSGPVLSLAATPDGRWLCSGSADHTIRVWQADEENLVRALTNHLGPVRHLAFRPAADKDSLPYLASAGSDQTIRIWQPTIGRMVRIVRHSAPVSVVAWSADGGKLFSGAKDGKLRLVDGDSDEILAVHEISQHRIVSMALAMRRGKLLVGGSDGKVIEQSIKKLTALPRELE